MVRSSISQQPRTLNTAAVTILLPVSAVGGRYVHRPYVIDDECAGRAADFGKGIQRVERAHPALRHSRAPPSLISTAMPTSRSCSPGPRTYATRLVRSVSRGSASVQSASGRSHLTELGLGRAERRGADGLEERGVVSTVAYVRPDQVLDALHQTLQTRAARDCKCEVEMSVLRPTTGARTPARARFPHRWGGWIRSRTSKQNTSRSLELGERLTPRTQLLPAFEDLAPFGEPVSDASAVLLDQ